MTARGAGPLYSAAAHPVNLALTMIVGGAFPDHAEP
jgi:hypothetical protein